MRGCQPRQFKCSTGQQQLRLAARRSKIRISKKPYWSTSKITHGPARVALPWHFLKNDLDEELTVMPVTSYVDLVMGNSLILQHDGAPAHFALDVRASLSG